MANPKISLYDCFKVFSVECKRQLDEAETDDNEDPAPLMSPLTARMSMMEVMKNLGNESGLVINKVYSAQKVKHHDLRTMVQAATEFGDDLEAVLQKHIEDKTKFDNFKLIIDKFKLVSDDPNPPHTFTLTIVCEQFPMYTCKFLNSSNCPTLIPYELLSGLSPGYPKVMMTSAFAYFIPDLMSKVFVLLLRAHMLYRYVYHERGSISNLTSINGELIKLILKSSKKAMRKSQMSFRVQQNLLYKYNLITRKNGNSYMVASPNVVCAAKVWEEKIIRRYSEQENATAV